MARETLRPDPLTPENPLLVDIEAVQTWEDYCAILPRLRAALRAAATDPAEPGGWRWECPSCDRSVSPMGMCETCGIFGVMRLDRAASTVEPGLDVHVRGFQEGAAAARRDMYVNIAHRLADALDSEAVANVIGPLESGEITLVSRILAAALTPDETEERSDG